MDTSDMTDRQYKVFCTISEIELMWNRPKMATKTRVKNLFNNLSSHLDRTKDTLGIDEDYFTLSYIMNDLYSILHNLNPSGTPKMALIKKLYFDTKDKSPKVKSPIPKIDIKV